MQTAREEHHQAIDWLNEKTNDDVRFFLVEIELWQIGDSAPAPKFQIISQPNDWTKAVRQTVADTELSETKILQREFWDSFKEYCERENTFLRLRSTSPQHWYDISLGTSAAHIALTVNTQSSEIACEVYISDNKDLYYALYEQKDRLEAGIGSSLEWHELPEKKASRIKLVTKGDILERSKWSEKIVWLKQKAELFHGVFGNQIKKVC